MELIKVEPEYVYVTIPTKWISIYQKILIMLADLGEHIIKNNTDNIYTDNVVLECYSMFNAAIAADKLNKPSLADNLIKKITHRLNVIYHGKDNGRSFVFPVDEHGTIKAYVTSGERPMFQIDADKGMLYEHKFNNGFDEHFHLGPEDYDEGKPEEDKGLQIIIKPLYEPHYECHEHIHDEHEYEHNHYNHESHMHHHHHHCSEHVDGHRYLHPIHMCDCDCDCNYGETHDHDCCEHCSNCMNMPTCECDKITKWHPCADIYVYFDGKPLDINKVDIYKYFDNKEIMQWHDVTLSKEDVGLHNFKVVVNYKQHTAIKDTDFEFNILNKEEDEN